MYKYILLQYYDEIKNKVSIFSSDRNRYCICIYNRNAQAQARADRSLQRQGKTLAQVALLRVGISR